MTSEERVFDTGRVRAGEQFAYWRQAVGEALVPVALERDREGPFAATLRSFAVGPIGIARIAAPAQRVRRTPALVGRRPGRAVYLSYAVRGGAAGRQDGRDCTIGPGDFALLDGTRPFELAMGRDFRHICFTLPRELLAPRLPAPRAATAVRVRGDRGAGALASEALRALAREGAALDRAAARRVAEHVAGLVAVALTSAAGAPPAPGRALLLQAICQEAEERLTDPDLSPATVAAAVGLSPRHVHRLFAERDTTFGRWVLERRLEGARRDLADPAWDHCTVAVLAVRWGFRDPSYFARAFRAHYGLSPRASRRAAGAVRSTPGGR